MREFLEHKKYNLDGKYRYSWIEESVDVEAENQLGVVHTNKYTGVNLPKNKLRLFAWVVCFCFLIIFVRVFYLQIFKGDDYFNLAEGNRIRIRPVAAERGIIYDRNETELIQNIPSFSLALSPKDLPKDPTEYWELLKTVAGLINTTPEQIDELLQKYKNRYYETINLAEDLDYKLAITIYTKYQNLPGVLIQTNTKRLYKYEDDASKYPSLSHIIGYLGKLSPDEMLSVQNQSYQPGDLIGKTGLEKEYETELRGTYGKKKIEVNAYGKEQNVLAEEAPVPGKNLVLSIDLEAQNKLEQFLSDELKAAHKTRGAAVAMDPQTGKILALVNLPSFNNNDFSGGISQEKYKQYLDNPDKPLFNRAIKGNYPSGSAIKPVIVLAALTEKIITANTTFISTGGLQVNKWFFPDWKAGGHGPTNARKAIAWSVNTFFYYIGGGYKEFKGLGLEKITFYLKKFGLGKPTGIDLPEENSGFLPSAEWKKQTKKEDWYTGDTYNLSIGQGDLLVTPLQVANWTATVANGGKLYEPYIVEKIIDPITNETQEVAPKLKQELTEISASDFTIAKLGMRDCVTGGSCGMLRSLPFTSAGKTGTAQWNSNKDTHAWSTSFAPYENPKIVVTVLVEEGGEGSQVAMPIAQRFLSWWGTKYLND